MTSATDSVDDRGNKSSVNMDRQASRALPRADLAGRRACRDGRSYWREVEIDGYAGRLHPPNAPHAGSVAGYQDISPLSALQLQSPGLISADTHIVGSTG